MSLFPDTIVWFDISINDSKTKFRRINDSIVLNYETVGIETETIVSGIGNSNQSVKVTGKYFFAKKMKVNPDWYENYKEASFNEMIKIGKGIQLMYINNGLYWQQIIKANSIEHKAVKAEEITIHLDKNSILKQI